MNGHKIINQNAMHFITPAVVLCLDVFTRKGYKNIIVLNPEDYFYSSARNYLDEKKVAIDIEKIDMSCLEGFVFI